MQNEQLPSRPKRLFSYTLIFLTAASPLHPAWGAAMVAVDKHTQISQQNNIPVINIATPNGAGISHNKFQDFNVDKQGAVLNNATTNVNAQIAGQIKANTNLKGNAANLIINEVAGSSRSELQGKLEVVGKGANVLIANPNGITCNGCSFVNTPAITLTTGKPILDNKGALSAVEVKKGSVVIGANGMNAEAQTYADIISRATELNGQIKAKNLTLIQGTNRVDFQKGTVTPIVGEGVKPSVSVDTKALGGMYANQVKLVSTEAGVGVNLSHVQTNQDDLTLTVDGKITLAGNIQAKKDINVSTKNLQINTNATVNAAKDITLATDTLTNNGKVIAGKDMRVFADTVNNTGNGALIQAQDNLWMQKNAKGDLSSLIDNKSATIKTNAGDLVIRTKKLNNQRHVDDIYFLRQWSDEDKFIVHDKSSEKGFAKWYLLQLIKEGIRNDGVFELGKYAYLDYYHRYFHVNNTYMPGYMASQLEVPYEDFVFLAGTVHQVSNLPIIHLGGYQYGYSKINKASELISGKNIYINGNELNNIGSNITAKNDIILTGAYFNNTSLLSEHSFERYYRFFPNALRNELAFTSSPELADAFDKNPFYHFRFPDETFALRDIKHPTYQHAAIRAGNNFISDFSQETHFNYEDIKYKNMSDKELSSLFYKKPLLKGGTIKWVEDDEDGKKAEKIVIIERHHEKIQEHHNNVVAKNIFIKSNTINIDKGLESDGDIYLFSKNKLQLNKSKLSAKKNITLSANGNIDVDSILNSNDLLLNSIDGSITIQQDKNEKIYSKEGSEYQTALDIKNSIILKAKNDISISNVLFSQPNSITLDSGKNINIHYNLSILPMLRASELFSVDNYQKKIDRFIDNVGVIKLKGDFFAQADKNINITDTKVLSDKNISLISGNMLSINKLRFNEQDNMSYDGLVISPELSPYLTEYDFLKLKRVIPKSKINNFTSSLQAKRNLILMSKGDMEISAGNLVGGDNITLHAEKGMRFKGWQHYLEEFPFTDSYQIGSVSTLMNSHKNINITANDNIDIKDTHINAGNDISLSSGGNIKIESIENPIKRGSEYEIKHKGSEFNSGGNITLLSEGSTLFQFAKLKAKGFINIAAKGGILYAQAMVDTASWQEKSRHCKRVLGIKSCFWGATHETKTIEQATNKVTELTAGNDINLFAKDDVTLEATKISTGKNAKITSQAGKINFRAVKDGHFERAISHSDGFFITHRDKGFNKETWVLPKLYIGGELTIDAHRGVSAEIKQQNQEGLARILQVVGNTDETKWLAGLKDRKDVQWNLVKDAYDSWDYKSQQLNPLASGLIMITVAALTQGSGAAAWAGEGAVSLTGTTGASAAFAYGAGSGGMSALASQAAVALVENKGDISKTLRTLGDSDTVKSIMTQMVISGALNGLDVKMEWSNGNPAEAKLPLLAKGDWNKVAQRVAAQSMISSTINTAAFGGSFTDNFQRALLSNIGSQVGAEGASLIGDNSVLLGPSGKALSHAVVAGISAEISGANVKGAVVGALAAELAGMALGDNFIGVEQWQKKSEIQAQAVKVLGGVAGAVFTGDVVGLYSGADSAENTFRFNHLLHDLAMEFDGEIQKCGRDLNCQSNIVNKFAAFSHKNSFNLDNELKENPQSVLEVKKKNIENAFALAERPYWASYLGFDVMQNNFAKQYVQYWNTQDLTKIDTQTPSWRKFASWVSEPDNQLLLVSGGFLAKGLSDYTINYFSRNSSIKTISASEIGMQWSSQGGSINKQGMPWEDVIAKTLPNKARLPQNFKVFDFYHAEQKLAISAKSLDTQTLSKLNKPKQIYSSLKNNIDSTARFDNYTLLGISLRSDMIAKREIWLSVPHSTTKVQWAEINRAVSYGQGVGIEVKITQVK